MAANTRATRSRYSSPAQPPPDRHGNAGLSPAASAGNHLPKDPSSRDDTSRSFMANWLEPDVQKKTSYEEAGLVKTGLLENMAPLGTLPKTKKIIFRAAASANAPKGTSSPKPPDAPSPAPASTLATPAPPSPAPETPLETPSASSSTTAAPAASAPAPKMPVMPKPRNKLPAASLGDEVDDDDYQPKDSKATRRRQSGRASKPKKPFSPDIDPSSSSRKQSDDVPTAPDGSTAHSTKAFADKVVDSAVDEAMHFHRYPTAFALRQLYDARSDEPGFVTMIQDVFNQTADERTMAEFTCMLEDKKREGARGHVAYSHMVAQKDSANAPPEPPRPRCAPFRSMIIDRRKAAVEEPATPPRVTKRIKITHARTSSKTEAAAATVNAPAAAPGTAVTSATDMDGKDAARTASKAKTPGSRKRGRRRVSKSSISSLSSVGSVSPPTTAKKPRFPAATKVSNPVVPESPTPGDASSSPVAPAAASPTKPANPPSSTWKSVNASQPQENQETDKNTISVVADTAAAAAAAAAAADTSTDAPKPQPIITRRKSLATTKQRSTPRSSASNSPSTTYPDKNITTSASSQRPVRAARQGRSDTPAKTSAEEAIMPGRVSAAELFPNLPRKTPESSLRDEVDPDQTEAEDDALWQRKQDVRRTTNNYVSQESSVRGSPAAREATPTRSSARKTRQSLLPSLATRAGTRSASKRRNGESDEDESSPTVAYPPLQDEPATSAAGSRAVTPVSQRPAKKAKTGIRIKLSPVKKKGAAAGIPRPVGESSTASNAATREQSADNDEYCSACGNAGDVLCCDGCPRSFHFECVGISQDALPDEWYCNECFIRQYPSRVPVHRGVFGNALNQLEKSNPRAFSLPKRVQNRFEGVRAGKDGDYEEIAPKAQQARDRRRVGYDEAPDFFKIREDGQAVLCHHCQTSATDSRPIVPCSVCTFHWHLDCLDPPLAVPPYLKTWKCPAHTGDLLLQAPPLAPAHRFRKLKGAQVISPAITRGIKNNGHIDLDWDDEPEPSKAGWTDPQSFGKTYKLPVKGVILDFIEQLRHKGAGYGPRQQEMKWLPSHTLPLPNSEEPLRGSALDRRLEEMQVSLTLTGLQHSRSDGIDHLRSALLNTADANMLSLMAKANADNIEAGKLTNSDKQGLRAMAAQMDAMSARIRVLLGEDGNHPAVSALASPGATSAAEPTPLNSPRNKMAHDIPPTTEPTPPSTIDPVEGAMELDEVL